MAPTPGLSTSPFSRLIGIGYYDGPIDGFVQRFGDDGLFSFAMIDCDDAQDLRVFEIRRLHGVTFNEMVASLGGDSSAQWLSWFPHMPLDETQNVIVEQAKRASRPVAVVVAYNLLQPIAFTRDIDEHFVYPSDGDWFSYFGLSRDARIT